jgi:multimeric flavodoxin WrbA
VKNILVITGSPRESGNSALLANAFIEGAETAGNKVSLFETGKMKINACRGCGTCFTKGSACSFDDDFNKLAPMLEEADIIVFCTPLYWFTFPSQLKSAIDKLCSFTGGKNKLKIRQSILIVCAALDDTGIFEGIIKTYELISKYQGWEKREILTVPNVNKIGDIKNTTGLEKAKNIGLNIK